MKKVTFKIIIAKNGGIQAIHCESKKRKNKWLYNYLTNQESLWAWEQWKNSKYKTFKRWFKEFIKPKWEESNWQTFRIKKTLILIKKEENK